MATIKDLRNWMVGDLLRPHIQIKAAPQSSDEKHFQATIFTASNSYSIAATEKKKGKSYLGCIAQSRRYRPGEDWFRGNDLSDGPLSPETWRSILSGIVRYELQTISEWCKDNEGRSPKTQPIDTPPISTHTGNCGTVIR